MRVLVYDSPEPKVREMVILTLSLDKRLTPLNQVTSTVVVVIKISVAELMEMVQVRVRGVVLPANSGPGGTVMLTSGVETGK